MGTDFIDSIRDPALREQLRKIQSQGMQRPEDVPNVFKDPIGAVGAVGINFGRDVQNIWEGIKNLPEFAVQLVKHPIDVPLQVVRAVFDQYQDLFLSPIDTFGKRPLTTFLDAIGAVGITGKALRVAGAVTSKTGASGHVARAVRMFYDRGLLEQAKAVDLINQEYLEYLRPAIRRIDQETNAALAKYADDPLIQQDLIYAMQGTRNPFIDVDKTLSVDAPMGRLHAKLGKRETKKALKRLEGEFKASLDLINNSGLFEHVSAIENYITQVFKPIGKGKRRFDKETLGQAVEKFKTDNPFNNPRAWQSFVQAMESDFGLLPAFDTAEEFLRYNRRTTVTAYARAKLFAELFRWRGADGHGLIEVTADKLGDAAKDYVLVREPNMQLKLARALLAEGDAAKMGLLKQLKKQHPEFYADLNSTMTDLFRMSAKVGKQKIDELKAFAKEGSELITWTTKDIGLSDTMAQKLISGRRSASAIVRSHLGLKGSKIGSGKDALKSSLLETATYVKEGDTVGKIQATWAPGNHRKLLRSIGRDISPTKPKVFDTFDDMRRWLKETQEKATEYVTKGKLKRGLGQRPTSTLEVSMPKGVYMHKDAVVLYKALTEMRMNSNWAQTASRINAVIKKSALSFSLFHAGALTESAVGVLGLKGIPLPFFRKERWLPKDMGDKALRAHVRGLELVKHNPEMAQELAKYGVLPAEEIIDANMQLWRQSLDDFGDLIDSKIGGTFGTKAVGVVKKASDWFDKGLWDRYHNGLKAYSYYILKEDMLKRFGKTMDPAEISRRVADWVNDAYGGLNWQKLMVSPRAQQQMSWLMLAPDWTLANLRVAFRPVGELSKAVRKKLRPEKWVDDLGNALPDPDPIVMALGARYWRNMIAGQFIFGNITNKLFSAYAATQRTTDNPFALDLSLGHFMWDNDKGSTTSVYHPGGKDEKGRNRYIRLGKQMREPFHWLANPMKTFGGKTSPGLQQIWAQVSGASPSGFPTEFKDKEFVESIPDRVAHLFSGMKPISGFGLAQSTFLSAAPVSAATTGYKLVAEFKRAIKRNDPAEVRALQKLARSNGYDPIKLFNMAKRDIAREERLKKEGLRGK